MPLASRSWGDGRRRILLVHGLSSNAAGWWRLGPDLAEAGFSVVAPDLRGHGATGPGDGYAVADYATDLLQLEGPWDAVMGHSLGGAVAVAATRQSPQWAKRLVLLDPALLDGGAPIDQVLAWLLEPWSYGPISPETVMASNPDWHPEDSRIKAQALLETSSQVVIDTVSAPNPRSVPEMLASVAAPVHILGSDPDSGGIVPVAVGERLEAELPHVAYRKFPGWGHSPHRQPERYQAVLAAILEAAAG